MRKLIPLAVYNSRFWRRTIAKPLRDYRDRPFSELVAGIRPHRILEIGVKYGWGAERMVKASGAKEYYGFDLSICDGVKQKLEKLGVEKVYLCEGDSRITLPRKVPFLPKMDVIIIDGGHSPLVVENDWRWAKELMHDGTVVIFDDYDLDAVKRVVDAIVGHQIEILDCHHPKAVVSLSRSN